MPVIQCPGCKKKLKLKAIKEGAKVKCPGCAEIFRPKAVDSAAAKPKASPKAASSKATAKPVKKRPAKKKRPAPVDDYDDFGGDDFGGDDYGDADDFGAPAPRRPRSGGKKAAKKKPAEKKSKKPLIIGLAVVAIAAIGGGAFWIFGGNSGEGGNEANVAESDGQNLGADGGPANKGQQPAMAAAANDLPRTTDPDFKWLPDETEVFAKIDFQRLLNGPVGSLLKSPGVAELVQQYEQQLGVSLTDLQSLVIGVTGLSEAAKRDSPPNPDAIGFTAVIRASKAIDHSKLQMLAPQAVSVSNGSQPYLKMQADANFAVAMWNADPQTILIAPETRMASMNSSSQLPTSAISANVIQGDSAIKLAFVPVDPDAVFRKEPIPENAPDPAAKPFIDFGRSVVPSMNGVVFSFDITEDSEVKAGIVSSDPAAAKQAATAIRKLLADIKQMNQDGGFSSLPPQAQFGLSQGMQALDQVAVEASGAMATASIVQTGAGTQLEAMAPMIPMIVQTAMAGGLGMTPSPGGFSTGPSPEFMMGGASPSGAFGDSLSANASSEENMKQITLAMLNFHDAYGRFPNAIGKGPNGEEWLSWRVHLLPFLGHVELYQQFALEEPWDSPTNLPLVSQMPDVYRSPEASSSGGKTVYQVPVSPGTAFEDSVGRPIRDFTDGTSNTILLVEVDTLRAAEWTRPIDYSFNTSNPLEGLLAAREAGYKVAYVDGSLRTIAPSTSPQSANAMFTRAAGDSPDQ